MVCDLRRGGRITVDGDPSDGGREAPRLTASALPPANGGVVPCRACTVRVWARSKRCALRPWFARGAVYPRAGRTWSGRTGTSIQTFCSSGRGRAITRISKASPSSARPGSSWTSSSAEIGLDRSAAAIVNVVKCRPPGNRDPLPDEIEACRPYLQAQLNHMQPDVIVTLGNFATRFILEEKIGITQGARAHLRADGGGRDPDVPSRGGSEGREVRRHQPHRCDPSGPPAGPSRARCAARCSSADGLGSAFERDAGHGAGRASSRPPFRGPRGARAAGSLLMQGLF